MNSIICPVSDQRINENISRISVSVIVIMTGIFLLTDNIWLMVFVLTDYCFRIFEKVKYSPVVYMIEKLFKKSSLPVKIVNKAPKVFASRLGFLLSVMTVAFYLYYPVVSFVFASVLFLCTFLDTVFNICFGCLLYRYFVYPLYNRKFQD